MNKMEQAALKHVAQELAYQRSAQAGLDAAADKRRRESADRKAGHLPACTLMKCCAGCGR
jgi:hypothetical protein